MIDWSGFQTYLEQLQPALNAWGQFVVKNICKELDRTFDDPTAVQITSFRVKEVSSALGKIAKKNYTDPKNQMTDLVGVRIVVLLSTHIPLVSEIIEKSNHWDAQIDRDPSTEIFNNPNLFDYQSKHYMLRSNSSISKIGDVEIPKGLPCEVQLRTIFQHAFAEVVHDKIYKSEDIIPTTAKRHCASSMALMETADHLFCETMRKISDANHDTDTNLKNLTSIYSQHLGTKDHLFDLKLNNFILDSLNEYITESMMMELLDLLKSDSSICENIKKRRDSTPSPFWSQPISLFAYWYVNTNHRSALYEWPLATFRDEIQQIYSDLGIAAPL